MLGSQYAGWRIGAFKNLEEAMHLQFNSNDSTRNSILEVFEFRGSSRVVRASSDCQLTVLVKCKLTVTRNSNDSTRTSILKTQKLRVSSLESSLSSFEWSCSSFESRWQRINGSIIFFSKYTYTCQSCWQRNFQVATLDAVSGSAFVNRSAY